MYRMLKVAGAALSLALGAGAGAAQATVVTITIKGTVTSSVNGDNLFGGGDLTGRTARSVFQIDTSKGFFTDFGNQKIYSGDPPVSPVGSTFEILGETTYGMPAENVYGTVQIREEGGGSDYFEVSTALLGADQIGAYQVMHYFSAFSRLGAFQGFDFVNLPDFTSVPDVETSGRFSFGRRVPIGKGETELRETSRFSYRLDSFTVTNGSVVPEPQTWEMLVIGFGVTGVALQQGRRARAKAALAA